MVRSILVATIVLWTFPALASPESAQERAQEDYVRKINFSCGTNLGVTYDGASLRKFDLEISRDQTDGANECNEPLRYLHYACATPAGKAAVKAAHLTKIVCKGTAAKTGSLTVQGGVITVERAFHEEKPFARSRQQFEHALKVSVAVPADGDPYTDEKWHDLAQQPNPVTDSRTYCMVNGTKSDFSHGEFDTLHYHREDATVKCYKDGELVTDLVFNKGRRTGFYTYIDGARIRRAGVRDEKRHGMEREIDNGKLKSQAEYADGEQVWDKTFHPSGKLATYSRTLKPGYAHLRVGEDGKIYTLDCSPQLRDDVVMKKLCGFSGAVTTSIYDGTGKVNRVVTFKDGVLQKEGAGNSDYAHGSQVAYKNGKKHGEERVLDSGGKLTATVQWADGVKDGKEQHFAEDGKRVIEESLWKKGELAQRTEIFLNGNPRLREIYESPTKMRSTAYWDTGKVEAEGVLVSITQEDYGYRWTDWCRDGIHKSYYENGTLESEESYDKGKRQGTSKSWWPNGKAASVEEYVDDRITKAKYWDKNGKLTIDEEYERDGSRKLKR
jgi:antitoxin component YwqK of YwqJK toxin-antitoxin module